MALDQGQEMTLTFNTHIPSKAKSVVCNYQLSGHWLQKLLKNPLFSLFLIEKPTCMFPNFWLGKRELVCLLLFTCYYVVFCLKRFPLPMGACDELHYFIVALPEPSI